MIAWIQQMNMESAVLPFVLFIVNLCMVALGLARAKTTGRPSPFQELSAIVSTLILGIAVFIAAWRIADCMCYRAVHTWPDNAAHTAMMMVSISQELRSFAFSAGLAFVGFVGAIALGLRQHK